MTTASSNEESVAVVDGPNGTAEIFEVWSKGRLQEYKVKFGDQTESFTNIGEAYIEAGKKSGKPT